MHLPDMMPTPSSPASSGAAQVVAETTTADFWVGCTIGEGADAKVVHARLKATGRNVAIKVFTKVAIQKDIRLIDRIRKERQLLSSKLKSEHVIKLWASFHDSQCLYLVMECGSGGDLRHLIHHGMKKLHDWTPSIPSYALQLLSTLEFLHTKNVLHCDLKPENVLVAANGKLKLADFGCAVDLGQCQQRTGDCKYAIMGTTDYASPQIIRAETVSVDCDLWAFGCILYAMWEGESPFHDESDALAVRRICDYTGKLERGRNIEPDTWMAVIQDILQPDPLVRLGMKDFEWKGENGVTYTSIRNRFCLKLPVEDKAVFIAPAPSWWHKSQALDLKDGAAGWISFLL